LGYINSRFNSLLLCNTLSTSAGWINKTTIPLAIFYYTGSASDTGIAFAIAHLPAVTIGLFSGAIVDKNRAETIIKFTTGFSALCLGLLSVIIIYKQALPIIYLLLFINSSLSAIQIPAYQSLIVKICPSHKLIEVNSKIGITDQMSSIFAPLFAGLALTIITPRFVFLFSAISYFSSMLVISPIRTTKNTNNSKITVLKSFRDGFYPITRDTHLFSCVILFIFSNFSTTLVQSTIIAILSKQYGIESYGIGLFFAALGVFGIIGHKLARYLCNLLPVSTAIIYLSAASGLVTGFTLLNPNVVLFSILWGLTVLFGALNVTQFNTYRQSVINDNVMGRVVSVSRAITYFPIPISSALAGFIFETYGNDTVMMISAATRIVGVFVAMILLFFFRSRREK
jgi:predicted MFS family arabinose efflux permease